jgi:hypothetical protein
MQYEYNRGCGTVSVFVNARKAHIGFVGIIVIRARGCCGGSCNTAVSVHRGFVASCHLGMEVSAVVGEVLTYQHRHRPSIFVFLNKRVLLCDLMNVSESSNKAAE